MTRRGGEDHGTITPYQMTAVVVGAVIGVGVLAMPRIIVQETGAGAVLPTLLGALPAALAWLASVKLARWYRGQTPTEYKPRIITRPLGWLVCIAWILFLVAVTALTAREFGEVVRVAVLPSTPIEVTVTLMLLVSAWFIRYDMQVIARTFEVFFPIMVVPLTVLGLLALKNARVSYLFPLLDHGWAGLLRGTALASVGYVALIIGFYLLPSLAQPKRAVPAGLWAIGLSAFVYVLSVTASLSVFGPEEIKQLTWPTLELVKGTSIPGMFLERLESGFIGIWVAAVFTTVAATYYTAVLNIVQLFHLHDHKVMVVPLVPVLYVVAMMPGSVQGLYRLVTVLGLYGVLLTQVAPLVLLAIGYLRQKGASRRVHRQT